MLPICFQWLQPLWHGYFSTAVPSKCHSTASTRPHAPPHLAEDSVFHRFAFIRIAAKAFDFCQPVCKLVVVAAQQIKNDCITHRRRVPADGTKALVSTVHTDRLMAEWIMVVVVQWDNRKFATNVPPSTWCSTIFHEIRCVDRNKVHGALSII